MACSKRTALEQRQRTNQLTGYFIPGLLIALVIYATYVLIGPIAIHHYLASTRSPRPAAAAIILVVYALIVVILAATYVRLLITVTRSDHARGYIPKIRGPVTGATTTFLPDPRGVEFGLPNICTPKAAQHARGEKGTYAQQPSTALNQHVQSPDQDESRKGEYLTTLEYEQILAGQIDPPPGLEDFTSKDVYQCDQRGLPRWCGRCNNWKPDRVHHSDDVGRCIANFDHFCPWVGGVVSEVNYKFFIQLCFYAGCYSIFNVVVGACVLADRARFDPDTDINPHHIVYVAISAFFAFFTIGMFFTTLWHASLGMTTIDSIDRSNRTMFLAVRLPTTDNSQTLPDATQRTSDQSPPIFQGTITFPLQRSTSENNDKSSPHSSSAHSTLIAEPHGGHTGPARPAHAIRFAILQTPRGMNPWHCGVCANLRQVLGRRYWDWFLPIRPSPWCEHRSLRANANADVNVDVERRTERADTDPEMGIALGTATGSGTRKPSMYPLSREFEKMKMDVLGISGFGGR